jgi:hypothetical protein
MKKLVVATLLVSVLLSCKKSNTQPDALSILTSHTWYPVQTEISIVDSNTIITLNHGSGKDDTVANVYKFDTTFISDPCMQQSTFAFDQTGHMKITSSCSIGSVADTPYTLVKDPILKNYRLAFISIYQGVIDEYYSNHAFALGFNTSLPADAYIYSTGVITTINNAAFVFEGMRTANINFTSYANNTIDKVAGLAKTTYKSR